jgi:uncharacterized membrane protein/predicted DsbA family dithiol-disulfide isomerase
MSKARDSRSTPRLRIAFLVLCAIGAAMSADLMRLHVNVHTDPDYQSYCAINEYADCEAVAASEHAVLMGLPLALWGLFAYLAQGGLAIWGLRRPLAPPGWPYGSLFWSGVFTSAFGIYLFAISHFVIESVCVVCAGTHLVNFLLLATATGELRRLGLNPMSAWIPERKSFSARAAPLFAFAGSFAVALALVWSFLPAYWVVEPSAGPGGLPAGVTREGFPWIGAREPILTIAEFSDYQCPHCSRGHDEMRKLIAAHPDTVRLVHRHFPLDQKCNRMLSRPFHPHACKYALLAYCAERQGRFWEANDYLFANGRRENPVTVRELAAAIGIEAAAVERCVKGAEASRSIERDLDAGQSFNIQGTPTFIIEGRTYTGQIPEDVLSAALARLSKE